MPADCDYKIISDKENFCEPSYCPEDTFAYSNKSDLPSWANLLIKEALLEDVGFGDITANLIPKENKVKAELITRENMIICGIQIAEEIFKKIDSNIYCDWQVSEGDYICANTCLLKLYGPARGIITAERAALNFIQFLSGTATITREYVNIIKSVGSSTKLLDTRKTIPVFRQAQKYAVRIGGGKNHRMGLYDSYLIKENHIESCGGILPAIKNANLKKMESKKNHLVEIEVENISQVKKILDSQDLNIYSVDVIMLDNFDINMIKEAIEIRDEFIKSKSIKKVLFEVSGNIDLFVLKEIAKTNVDYISVGAITKHVKSIDLSLRVL